MPIVDLPLDQRNIIITRSKEGILDIKKKFTSKGANVFDLPAISIGDPDDFNPLDEALDQINDFHWIIFPVVMVLNLWIKDLDILIVH